MRKTMNKDLPVFFALAAAFVIQMGPVKTAAQDLEPDDYGTASVNYYYVSAEEFQPFDPQNTYWMDAYTGGARYVVGPSVGIVGANVRLPSGALITGMAVVYEDSDPDDDLEVRFERTWWGIGTRGVETIGPSFFSSGTPGITRHYLDIDPDHTVSYFTAPLSVQAYRLVAFLDASYYVQLRGVIMYWKRQISPAPPTQTFPDVGPGYWAFQDWAFQEIEALAASGITTGFPDGTYRPTEPVTRAQMATFLARALGLHWAP